MSKIFNILPKTSKRKITASIGFVLLHNDLYIMIKNERGWDIPGGHVKKNETPLKAFKRELLEEAGCKLSSNPKLIAVLESKSNPDTGITVYLGLCHKKVSDIVKNQKNVICVSASELVKKYFGDKSLIKNLLKITNQI